jgi:succinate dehydrogenase / fumarate reductase flavoprotein subunit
LLDLAEVLAFTARERRESRGGHYREDFETRDDEKFLVHSMAYKNGDKIDIDWKPVVITNYQPMERKY